MDGVIDENGKPTQAFKSTVDIIGMARFFETFGELQPFLSDPDNIDNAIKYATTIFGMFDDLKIEKWEGKPIDDFIDHNLKFREKDFIDALAKYARQDKEWFLTAKRYCSSLIRKGEPIPEGLKNFVSDVLDGSQKIPGPPGPLKAVNTSRDYIFTIVLYSIAENFRIPFYKNDAGSGNICCLDVIIEAAKRNRIFLSRDAVRKIWEKNRPLFEPKRPE